MNRSLKLTLVASLCALAFLPLNASAVIITKADNTNALQLGTSWGGGTAPVSVDVADWSGTYNTAGSLSATFGANLDWQGISVGSIAGTAAGLISVGGTGAAPAFSLTVGSSGIDMSAANQNLVLNGNFFNFNTSQIWNVASGRNLRLAKSGTGAANADVDGSSAAAVITISGAGVVDLNQGGASGFADAAGYANFPGKWQINSGATVRGLRNGATAFGSNTSADAITLNGGTLAVGGISGSQGNWTWQTPITLTSGTTSSIDQQIFSGTGRSLILRGVMTGSGANTNLIFKETGATNSFDNDNLGYIIAGNNTFGSDVTVTIGGAVENGIGGRLSSVRLGGDGTVNSVVTTAGTSGTFGSAQIVNNGVLTLSHNNTWTLGNTISGTGNIRVGFVTGTSGQILTMSGPNSYMGGTSLDTGNTLNIDHATAIGTGTLTISGNGTFDNTSGAAITLSNNNPLTMSGGSPTFTGTNDLNFGTGAVTISGANRTITVANLGATLTLGGAIGQDIAGRNFTKAGAGTLVLGGINTYSGTTSISAGKLILNGSHAVGGAYTVAGSATLGGNGSTTSGVTVTGNIAPGTSIGTLGVGATTINGTYLLETAAGSLSDLLNVTGLLTLGGTSTLDLVNLSLVPTETYTIANYTTLGGTFNTVDASILSTHTVDYLTGNQIRLLPIPEPGTLAMLAFGMLSLWLFNPKCRMR